VGSSGPPMVSTAMAFLSDGDGFLDLTVRDLGPSKIL
jgi:hypothetical protein